MTPAPPKLLAILTFLAAGLLGCGSDGDRTLRIYSSLPLQGESQLRSKQMNQGMDLALEQADGSAGGFRVEHVALDDSSAQTGSWDQERTADNARRAARDPDAIAYIGEYNSPASAVSMPILNEAGIAQIGPSNTYVGLTTDDPGSQPGEPGKYFPSGRRTYARIVPIDTVQAAALIKLMGDDGCASTYVASDGESFGIGLAKDLSAAARTAGLETIDGGEAGDTPGERRASAADVGASGADCFLFSGVTANGAAPLYEAVADAAPGVRLYGSSGVCEKAFADPTQGGLPKAVGNRTQCTIATLDLDRYPRGRQFLADFEAAYGEADPDPYAIFGYEAMSLALDAIRRAGSSGDQREAVVEQLFATSDRDSVIGTYSIDRRGDTTLTDYGAYRIRNGRLLFDRVIAAG